VSCEGILRKDFFQEERGEWVFELCGVGAVAVKPRQPTPLELGERDGR
jgi:hypothetical protein